MKNIIIYTDGACSGNPGPGGYGAVLMFGEAKKELRGYEAHTTNQKMELRAAVEALQALKEPCEVDLYSDSAYLVNGWVQKWIHNWQKNGWKNSKKKDVENQDLWKELWALNGIHTIRWHKVKGHSDNVFNNRCDELARLAISENNCR